MKIATFLFVLIAFASCKKEPTPQPKPTPHYDITVKMKGSGHFIYSKDDNVIDGNVFFEADTIIDSSYFAGLCHYTTGGEMNINISHGKFCIINCHGYSSSGIEVDNNINHTMVIYSTGFSTAEIYPTGDSIKMVLHFGNGSSYQYTL